MMTSIPSRPRMRERVKQLAQGYAHRGRAPPEPYISPAWEEDDWSVGPLSSLNTCTHSRHTSQVRAPPSHPHTHTHPRTLSQPKCCDSTNRDSEQQITQTARGGDVPTSTWTRRLCRSFFFFFFFHWSDLQAGMEQPHSAGLSELICADWKLGKTCLFCVVKCHEFFIHVTVLVCGHLPHDESEHLLFIRLKRFTHCPLKPAMLRSI